MQHTSATGQRLVHRRAEPEVLRTGEHESPRLRVLVHDFLEVGGKIRRPLHLIDHGTVAVFVQEPARVLKRVGAHIHSLE